VFALLAMGHDWAPDEPPDPAGYGAFGESANSAESAGRSRP